MNPLLLHMLIWNGLLVALHCPGQVLNEELSFRETVFPVDFNETSLSRREPDHSQIDAHIVQSKDITKKGKNERPAFVNDKREMDHGSSADSRTQNKHRLKRQDLLKAPLEDTQTLVNNRTNGANIVLSTIIEAFKDFQRDGNFSALVSTVVNKIGDLATFSALSGVTLVNGSTVNSLPGASTVVSPAANAGKNASQSLNQLTEGVSESAGQGVGTSVGTVDSGGQITSTLTGATNGVTNATNDDTPAEEKTYGYASNSRAAKYTGPPRRYYPRRPPPIGVHGRPLFYPVFNYGNPCIYS